MASLGLNEDEKGISNKLLDISSAVVEIPVYGSVRSLNVGTASGVVMSLIRQQYSLH